LCHCSNVDTVVALLKEIRELTFSSVTYLCSF